MSDLSYKILNSLILPPISGKRPTGGCSSEDEGIPSLGGENILLEGGITLHELKRIPLSFFQSMPKGKLIAHDVLINKDGAHTGKVGIYKGELKEASINEHLFILRPIQEFLLDAFYLYYAMLLPETRHKIERRITGSAQPGLNSGFVNSVDIPHQDLLYQKKIARILSIIDEAIEKTEELIGKYEQIKAGMMHDLFTRGLTADGKLRPPRSEAPHLYHETPIGWIPKEWKFSVMRDKAAPGDHHLKSGPFGSELKGEHWVEDGHPAITIGALGEGFFITSELLHVGAYDAKRLSAFKLKLGDVVFSRVADVGRSAVIKDDQVGWIMSSNLMRISLDWKQVLPEFLQYQLSSDSRVKIQIRRKVNSSGREVANNETLNSIVFAWPTFEEQKAMVERADAVAGRIIQEWQYLHKLQNQKSGILHDLLTGKVPITVDEGEAADVG